MSCSYLKSKEDTFAAIDEEGWLHSGDQGVIDEDGFVTITGRLKELIVTSGGENVSPVPIENRLLELLPEVSNAILVGDKRNYLSCMFCLKTEVDPATGEPTSVLAPNVLEKSKELGKYDLCRVVNARYFPDSTDPDRDYIRLIVLEAQRTHP